MTFRRLLLCAFLLPVTLAAQPKAHAPEAGTGWGVPGVPAAPAKVKLFAYTFKHRRAEDAIELLQPLMSPVGTIEARRQDNTIAIRDTAAVLVAVEEACRAFDRPARPLAIEIMILEAHRSAYSPPPTSENLPSGLEGRLKKLFPHYTYTLLASTLLSTSEGEDVDFEIGAGYGVSFRSGMVDQSNQLKLKGFQVLQSGKGALKALFNAAITLRLDQQTSVMLAKVEDSPTAVVVALTPRLSGAAAKTTN